jgi:hypothetical protein
MQTAKQLSVHLVNKPGRLVAVLDALAQEKAGSRAFCVMDSGNRGTLRFVPENWEKAKAALDGLNIEYDVADVLLVEVPSQAGGMRKICRQLAAEHLNVEYTYGSISSPVGAKGGGLAVIRVNDLAKAQRVLGGKSAANGARQRRSTVHRPTYAR